jgi:hypothetical protein
VIEAGEFNGRSGLNVILILTPFLTLLLTLILILTLKLTMPLILILLLTLFLTLILILRLTLTLKLTLILTLILILTLTLSPSLICNCLYLAVAPDSAQSGFELVCCHNCYTIVLAPLSLSLSLSLWRVRLCNNS